MKNRFSGKYTAQLLTVLCLICILLTVACRSQEREADPLAPPQDGDGYFLLSTEEDFRWFISRDRDPYTNVRLANDLILNDTKGWENWADSPPENSYGAIPSYHGHFDGNGHALEGYHTPYGKWLAPLFSILEEDARVTDLTIRNSLFQTTYEDCVYKDADGKTDVVTASALCFANYGVIENCEVQAKVTGAWDAGGIVDTCVNTGSVTINQKSLSFCSPIYGIACNTVNPGKGQIENSFYLEEKALQDYPQRGVRKLKTDELTRFSPYFSGEKRLEKTDFTDFLAFVPYGPETDRDDPDYVHLAFGPPEDVVYKVAPGDNLWNIAKQYYGDGRYYGNLIWKNPALEEGPLLPGMEIIIPHRDLAAVRRYDEEGFDFAYCRLPSGESCPTRFVLSKPINWYYGTMEFAAAPGLETLWPKTPDAAQSEDIRIFYRVDANPDGDFFEGR